MVNYLEYLKTQVGAIITTFLQLFAINNEYSLGRKCFHLIDYSSVVYPFLFQKVVVGEVLDKGVNYLFCSTLDVILSEVVHGLN